MTWHPPVRARMNENIENTLQKHSRRYSFTLTVERGKVRFPRLWLNSAVYLVHWENGGSRTYVCCASVKLDSHTRWLIRTKNKLAVGDVTQDSAEKCLTNDSLTHPNVSFVN
ncbi:hypothetical protein Zmor_019444 [Zophobas morio]|uniref:Uncharacterized protein n=1 Tax=Zophobas morio TaxID=2755281 RepID=A0AA38M8T5_9CUCU|nr:hypothetical protein Zmor_019444 [Zophobas morio]